MNAKLSAYFLDFFQDQQNCNQYHVDIEVYKGSGGVFFALEKWDVSKDQTL